MTDMISRDRAVEYLNGIADEMAPTFPKGDYADGYLDGYRQAARSLQNMILEADVAIIADMQKERANA